MTSPSTVLLLLQFPWLDDFRSVERLPTLLDGLHYAPALRRLGWSVRAAVKPSEVALCERLVSAREGRPPAVECVPAEHRMYAHRNIAAAANGRAHLLFAHADMFLNLRGWAGVIADSQEQSSFAPAGGLLAKDSKSSARSLCLRPELLHDEPDWFWHNESASLCEAASPGLGVAACCFGWADVAFLPVAAHAAFREGAAAFASVQCEVAIPTLLNWIARRGVARFGRVSCLGGSNVRLSAARGVGALCAHRIDLKYFAQRGGGGHQAQRARCSLSEAPQPSFPGEPAAPQVEADDGGACWLTLARVNLPNPPRQQPCDQRYRGLDEAKAACVSDPACGGVMRDNGVRCGGTGQRPARFQLRRGRQLPAWSFSPGHQPRGDTRRAWLLHARDAAGCSTVHAVARQLVARAQNATAKAMDGAEPYRVVHARCA
mmetsp:Transcript_18855/g.63621  ORF Transcript_18855/g.63621 Transcript_18855/m.63621 type:complete len:432 (-) Transcript_18855:52-1347(-)